jgi:hypothetical protein
MKEDSRCDARREFERRMRQARLEPGEEELVRGVWKIGAEDFRDWLADKLARRGRKGERASEQRETDAALAERMVREALAQARWREIDLATQPKGHHVKVKIAQQLSWNRHLWVVHCWRLASPGPETGGPLQHPVAQTTEVSIVSTGFGRTVWSASTAKDQASNRAAISSSPGKTGARDAREGRRDS